MSFVFQSISWPVIAHQILYAIVSAVSVNLFDVDATETTPSGKYDLSLSGVLMGSTFTSPPLPQRSYTHRKNHVLQESMDAGRSPGLSSLQHCLHSPVYLQRMQNTLGHPEPTGNILLLRHLPFLGKMLKQIGSTWLKYLNRVKRLLDVSSERSIKVAASRVNLQSPFHQLPAFARDLQEYMIVLFCDTPLPLKRRGFS